MLLFGIPSHNALFARDSHVFLCVCQTRVQASTLTFPEIISKLPQIGVRGLYRGSVPAILGQFSRFPLCPISTNSIKETKNQFLAFTLSNSLSVWLMFSLAIAVMACELEYLKQVNLC